MLQISKNKSALADGNKVGAVMKPIIKETGTQNSNFYEMEDCMKNDDRKLFEMLILEGMQAGLSWLTILNKRTAFREAFDEFDYEKIALYGEDKIDELMQNADIVRNRLKIKSAIINAQQFIKVQEEYGSFDVFIWSYVGNKPILNHFKSEIEIPTTTPLSDKISKDLKKRF